MEYVGKDPNHVHGSVHAPSFDRHQSDFAGKLSEEYHTYSIDWFADKIDFFFNGEHYMTVNKNESGGHWPFDQPMFLLLNLAIGGSWPGSPDASTSFP